MVRTSSGILSAVSRLPRVAGPPITDQHKGVAKGLRGLQQITQEPANNQKAASMYRQNKPSHQRRVPFQNILLWCLSVTLRGGGGQRPFGGRHMPQDLPTPLPAERPGQASVEVRGDSRSGHLEEHKLGRVYMYWDPWSTRWAELGVPLYQRFLTFYSNFPTLATTKLLFPPFPSPTYLKIAI